MRGFSLLGAMGFKGLLAVAMSSWDAQDVLEEVRSNWIHSIFWSWAIWPPLPLVALEEWHTFRVPESSIKELIEIILLNTRKPTSAEIKIHFPLLFMNTVTHFHGRQIFRLQSWTLLWIVCSHLCGRSGVTVEKKSDGPPWYCVLHAEAMCFDLNLQANQVGLHVRLNCEDVVCHQTTEVKHHDWQMKISLTGSGLIDESILWETKLGESLELNENSYWLITWLHRLESCQGQTSRFSWYRTLTR